MNEDQTKYSTPDPIDTAPRPRESPCGHGRSPKDQRGNRDARKRGRILASLYGGKQVSR